MNGYDVRAQHHYLLTPTRLLWRPFRCRPDDEPEIDGFAFKDARSFRVSVEHKVRVIVVTLPGQKLTVSLLPYGAASQQLAPAIDTVLMFVASVLKGYGASQE